MTHGSGSAEFRSPFPMAFRDFRLSRSQPVVGGGLSPRQRQIFEDHPEKCSRGTATDEVFRWLLTAEDIADVVMFLVSKEADYMTGQAINVTGGAYMD
jgi:NAD(P)-dependent dehydrogenase (short-subunit alcohol dehydrogenase family)